MLVVSRAPSQRGAPNPFIPGYSEAGTQQYFRGKPEGDVLVYRLPDNPRNRHVVAALPDDYDVQPFPVDPRDEVMEKLRALGIPHRKNEKLETLLKKLPTDGTP